MESKIKFSTHTDQRWYAAYTALICLGLAAAGGIGMWLWLKMPGPALLVGGVCVFMALIMGLVLSRQRSIGLDFDGGELYIAHLNGQHYHIYDVPAGDFVCRQNFLEKKYNTGRIQVKNSIFNFYGVQNYAETCRYIQENFPDC